MQLIQFFTNRGTQLVCLGLKTRDVTDTLEAVTLGLIHFLDRGTQLVLPHSTLSVPLGATLPLLCTPALRHAVSETCVFRCVHVVMKSKYLLYYVCSVSPSVCLSACISSIPTGWIFVKFDIYKEPTWCNLYILTYDARKLKHKIQREIWYSEILLKFVKKIQIWLLSDKNIRHFTRRPEHIWYLPVT